MAEAAAGQPVIDNRPGSNGGSRPVPDPTYLTGEAIKEAISAERDWTQGQIDVRDERLAGIDKATQLAQAGVEKMPALMDEKIAARAGLVDEKFSSVAQRFVSLQELSKREAELAKDALNAAFAASKEGVAAAFAAQKEDANRRDEANGKAIDKSEKATTETIKTNQESNKLTTDALAKTLDEVKLAVSRIESTKVGATENRTGLYAAIGIVGTILGILIAATTVIAILKP